MTVSVGLVKKIVLAFIGGVKLMPVPTVQIGGTTAVTQLGGLAGMAASFAGGALGGLSGVLSGGLGSALGGALGGALSGGLSGALSGAISSGGLSGALGGFTAGSSALSAVGKSLTGALGGNIGGLDNLTSKFDQANVDVDSFSNIIGEVGSLSTTSQLKAAADRVGVTVNYGELSDISSLNAKLESIGVNPAEYGDLNEISNVGRLSDTLSSMGVSKEFDFGDLTGVTASIPVTPATIQPQTSDAFAALVQREGGLNFLAKSLATGGVSLDETLSSISRNPVSSTISSTKTTLNTLTACNYTGLDSSLSNISSDPALSAAYQQLKLSIGGPDGLSGAVSYVNAFEDHTNRLSGITLSSDVTGIIPEEENTEIFEYKYDLPMNTPYVVASFTPQKIRSAKFFIQATSNVDHQTTEVFVVHDNLRVYTREVDVIYSHDPFITFTSQFTTNNVTVLATSTKPNTDIVIYSIRLPVITKANSNHTIDQGSIIDNARVLKGFFPEDNVDYISAQTGSLKKANTVAELNTQINDAIIKLNSSEFNSLSVEDKKQYINSIASSINTRSVSLQTSIDSDLSAYSDLEKVINAADVVSTLVINYASIDTKSLFSTTTAVGLDQK